MTSNIVSYPYIIEELGSIVRFRRKIGYEQSGYDAFAVFPRTVDGVMDTIMIDPDEWRVTRPHFEEYLSRQECKVATCRKPSGIIRWLPAQEGGALAAFLVIFHDLWDDRDRQGIGLAAAMWFHACDGSHRTWVRPAHWVVESLGYGGSRSCRTLLPKKRK